jgi:hypothetical protein
MCPSSFSSNADVSRSSVDSITQLPRISEQKILSYAKYLSGDIGYWIVGTYEHALTDRWMMEKVLDVKRKCEELVNKEREQGGRTRKLECEVWRQEGSGSHRCILC